MDQDKTYMVSEMISMSKSEKPVDQALQYIWQEAGCSTVIFNNKRRVIIKNGHDIERLMVLIDTVSASYENSINMDRERGLKYLIKPVKKKDELFWCAVYASDCDITDMNITNSMFLLEMIMELWPEDFMKESETELIRSIMQKDFEKIYKLSQFQKVIWDEAIELIITSMGEQIETLVSLRKKIEKLSKDTNMYYISGDYSGKVIYVILSRQDKEMSRKLLEETIYSNLISSPYIACNIRGIRYFIASLHK